MRARSTISRLYSARATCSTFSLSVESGDQSGLRGDVEQANESPDLAWQLGATRTPAPSDTLTRSTITGLVTRVTLGSVTEDVTYNSFVELATQPATVGTTQGFSETYDSTAAPRDKLGRIVRKVETVNGVLARTYECDANGNRLSLTNASGSVITGTHDDQDRLESYGDFTYTYTANGGPITKPNAVTNVCPKTVAGP